MKIQYPPENITLAKVCLLAAASLLTSTLIVDGVTWTGTSGDWSEGTNWSTTPNPPATSGDDIIFNAPSSTTDSYIDSDWAANGSVNSITINDNGGASGTLNIRLSGVTTFTIGAGGVTSTRTTGTTNLRDGAGYTLTEDQTWTTAGNNAVGVINIWSDLHGSADLTLTGTSRYGFVGGSSASWTGDLTLDSTQVYLYNGSQFSRLGQTLTLNNQDSQAAVTGVINSNGSYDMSSNVIYNDQGSTDFLYSVSAGTATASQVNLSGNWSSMAALDNSIIFNIKENDPSVLSFSLSGDNSGLTSTITSGSSGAVNVQQGFLMVESDNALGASNSLYVTLGNTNVSSVSDAGLLTTDGHDISADIKSNVNGNTAPTDYSNIYLGISGAGSATYSGDVSLGASWATTGVEAPNMNLQAGAGATVTFSGTIQSESDVRPTQTENVKVRGGGTIILSGSNTYTATTIVMENSTLLVNNTAGSGTGTGAVVVESGSTIGGTGTITPGDANGVTFQSGSRLAPDGSIGTLTFDGGSTTGVLFTAETGSTFTFELDANGGTPDQVVFWNYVSGDVVLNDNSVNVSLIGTPSAAGDYSVTLFEFYSDSGSSIAISGITDGLALGDLGEGISAASFVYNSNGGTIDLNYSVIPESSTGFYVSLISLLGFLLFRRRKVRF